MFNPTRDQIRSFFIDAWRKFRDKEPLTPMEDLIASIIAQHPEYHPLLETQDSIDKDFAPEDGLLNPFLHLSLHLAVEEQLSIDQPAGIRVAFTKACERHQDRHQALHEAMECLGETIVHSQRNNTPLDADAYLAGLRRT